MTREDIQSALTSSVSLALNEMIKNKDLITEGKLVRLSRVYSSNKDSARAIVDVVQSLRPVLNSIFYPPKNNKDEE